MAQKKTIIIEAKDKTKVAFNKVKKNLKQTDQAVDKTKRSFDGLKAGIKGAIGALTIGAFVQATRSTLDMADALGKTSARLGLTTEGLQTLRFAASQSGMATEALEMGLQRFTRRLTEADEGTGVLKDTFKELGIELRGPNNRLKSAEALLGEVADKMAAIPDQGKRVKMAFSMFDSEGVKMVNMLQGGSENLARIRQELIDTGAIMGGQFIKDAEDANDAIDKFGTVMRVAFASAISGLAPLITSFASSLSDVVQLARQHPVLTAFAGAVSAVGLAIALFGGPATMALATIGALITAATILNNHFKTMKERANFAGLEMDKLQKHFKDVSAELDEVNQKMELFGKKGLFGTEDLVKKEKALTRNLFWIQESIDALEKKKEVEAEAAQASLKATQELAEKQRKAAEDEKKRAQDLLTLEKEKLVVLKKIQAYKEFLEKKASEAASKERMRLYGIAIANADSLKTQGQAHAEWMDQKEGFRDADMEALQEEHERQKAMVDAAYMGENQNKELHTANMLLIDKRYEKAKDLLAAQRLATILGQASQVAQELEKRGLMGFDTMKAFAIAEAIVNAYVAASKAWAQGGMFGAVSAGLTLALAMAQVDNIRKTQPAKREMGGSVSKGTPFLVGERGPEIFTPNQSGGITPNHQMGNANVTFNIQANDARGFDSLLQARRGMIVGMINKAMRNNAQTGLM